MVQTLSGKIKKGNKTVFVREMDRRDLETEMAIVRKKKT